MDPELVSAGLREQRHDALEAAYHPSPPPDLLALQVDCAREDAFRLHGYVVAPRTVRSYRVGGVPVEVDTVATLAVGGGLYVLKDGRRLLGRDVEVIETMVPWWYAVVTGNGIIFESVARERGFRRAFCGAPSYVAMRPVAEGESL